MGYFFLAGSGGDVRLNIVSVTTTLTASSKIVFASINVVPVQYTTTGTSKLIFASISVPTLSAVLTPSATATYYFSPFTLSLPLRFSNAQISEIEPRHVVNGTIIVGHASEDLSVITNGYVYNLPIEASVGSPTVITYNVDPPDTLFFINQNNGGEYVHGGLPHDAADTITYNQDTLSANLTTPVYSPDEDIITFQPCTKTYKLGADVDVGDTIYFLKLDENSVPIVGESVDCVLTLRLYDTVTATQETYKDFWMSDKLTFGYCKSGADIHNEVNGEDDFNDYLRARDYAEPESILPVNLIPTDILTSIDAVEPENKDEEFDSIIFYPDERFPDVREDFTDTSIIATDSSEHQLGDTSFDEVPLIFTSEQKNNVDQGNVFSDTIINSGDSYSAYMDSEIHLPPDGVIFTDTTYYDGTFEYSDSIISTDRIDEESKWNNTDTPDNISFTDSLGQFVNITDTITGIDSELLITVENISSDVIYESESFLVLDAAYDFFTEITLIDHSANQYKDEGGTDNINLHDDVDDTDWLHPDTYDSITASDATFDTVLCYDTITISHELTTDLLMVLKDSVILSDYFPDFIIIVTDRAIATTDAVAAELNPTEVSDSVTLVDSTEAVNEYYDAIISSTDSAFDITRSVVDSIVFTQDSSYSGDFLKEYFSSVTITDYAAGEAKDTEEDTISLSDNITQEYSYSDSIISTTEYLQDFSIGLKDTLTATHTYTYGGAVEKSFEDTITLYDSTINEATSFPFDILHTTDVIDLAASLIDTVVSTTILNYNFQAIRIYSDSVTDTDSYAYGGELTFYFYDQINGVDYTTAQLGSLDYYDSLRDIIDLDVVVQAYDSITATTYIPYINYSFTCKDSLIFTHSQIASGEESINTEDKLIWTDISINEAVAKPFDKIYLSDAISQEIIVEDFIYSTTDYNMNFLKTISDRITGTTDITYGGQVTIYCEDSIVASDTGLPEDVFNGYDVLHSLDTFELVVDIVDTIVATHSYTTSINILKVYTDSIIETSIAPIISGSMSVNYTERLIFKDYGSDQQKFNGEDIITIKTEFDRFELFEDTIYSTTSSSNIITFGVSDTLIGTHSISIGGAITVTPSDSVIAVDIFNREIPIRCFDSLAFTDELLHLISVTDTIISSDSFSSHTTITVEETDAVVLTQEYTLSGILNLNYYDSVTIKTSYTPERLSDTTDVLFALDVVDPGKRTDILTDTITVYEHVYAEYIAQTFGDSITFHTDSIIYFSVTWFKAYSDNFNWKPQITSIKLLTDSFEPTESTLTTNKIYSDAFEWFAPYRSVSFTAWYRDEFEIDSIVWNRIFIDHFTPIQSTVVVNSIYVDNMEWYAPYHSFTYMLPYGDSFEYEPQRTSTIIKKYDFEVTPPEWHHIYEFEDPSSTAEWKPLRYYIFDDPESTVVWLTPHLLIDSFEVENKGKWKTSRLYVEDYEISNVVNWKAIYLDTYESEPTVAWHIYYNDDFEKAKKIKLNIFAGAEKTNKRLPTNINRKYGNLVKYWWIPVEPKPNFILHTTIVALSIHDVGIKTYIHAQGMNTLILRTKVSTAYSWYELAVPTNIRTYGELTHKYKMNLSITKYFFKKYHTNIYGSLATHSKVVTTNIPALVKERVKRFIPTNIDCAVWRYMLWKANISTAGGGVVQTNYKLNIYTHKLIVAHIGKKTHIQVVKLFGLYLKVGKATNIESSYMSYKEGFFADIACPLKEVANKQGKFTNIKTATGNYKVLRVTLSAYRGSLVPVQRLNIRGRQGESVLKHHTNIKLAADNTNRRFKVSVFANYTKLSKPFLGTYIGGPIGNQFIKEVTPKGPKVNIKAQGEYFWQYSPINNRRRTHIVAGAVEGYPFYITLKLKTSIRTVRETGKTLKSAIIADFIKVNKVINRTNIYALRCAMCMKHNIRASYRNYLVTPLWVTYGLGSVGSMNTKLRTNVKALRVPQKYHLTNIELGARAVNKVAYRAIVSAWRGPTYVVKQKLWKTNFIMTKLIERKIMKTHMNVGRIGYKVQTVSNIWTQKGEFKILKMHVSAPIAAKMKFYNLTMSATYASFTYYRANLWVDRYDAKHMLFGGIKKAADINIFASSNKVEAICNTNIKAQGEILHFISCGIFEVAPPLYTNIYGARTLFASIVTTELRLIEIISRMRIEESVSGLMDTFEWFEFVPFIWKQHVEKYADDFNNRWLSFKMGYRFNVVNETFAFPIIEHLFYDKCVQNFDGIEVVKYNRHVVKVSEPFTTSFGYTYSEPISNSVNDEWTPSVYTDRDGDPYMDAELVDSVTAQDGYLYDLLVLEDTITVRDTWFSSYIVVTEKIYMSQYCDYPFNVYDKLKLTSSKHGVLLSVYVDENGEFIFKVDGEE